MITETSAVAFRQNLGEMINQVQFRKDSIVITKDGKPVAALIDAQLSNASGACRSVSTRSRRVSLKPTAERAGRRNGRDQAHGR